MNGIMNSPKSCSSPTYKNIKYKHKQSPIELKEKMRKDYKSKVQNCRDMLLNRFRGNTVETELRNTLTEIYKNLYNFYEFPLDDNEETNMLEEVKNELIQEELEWWLEEYEKSEMADVDWSLIQQEDEENNVICPLCQKTNFDINKGVVHCPNCCVTLKSEKSVLDIKKAIFESVEKHSISCTKEPEFSVVDDLIDTRIYLICHSCSDMQLVI